MQTGAVYCHKMGNDLVTERQHRFAFFCVFASLKRNKTMQYDEFNQLVTFHFALFWNKGQTCNETVAFFAFFFTFTPCKEINSKQ